MPSSRLALALSFSSLALFACSSSPPDTTRDIAPSNPASRSAAAGDESPPPANPAPASSSSPSSAPAPAASPDAGLPREGEADAAASTFDLTACCALVKAKATQNDNLCFGGVANPDCPMTLPGGYCDPNGDGSFDDGDWPRGWAELRAACP